jgi:Protein of unknown function (DUF1360)
MTSTAQPHADAGPDADLRQATEPAHYGAINAAYLVLLAAVVGVWRCRGGEAAIPRGELPTLGIATFALSKVVAREKIGTWVREPFVEENAARKPQGPRGQGMRHAIGELLTCTRCVGAWAALALVGLRVASPPAGRLAATVLATSGINDFLQAGFKLTTEGVNRIEE